MLHLAGMILKDASFSWDDTKKIRTLAGMMLKDAFLAGMVLKMWNLVGLQLAVATLGLIVSYICEIKALIS